MYGKATPPDAVNGVSGTATAIAAGDYHSCAIQAGTGNVVCWGYDGVGRATPPDAVNGVWGTATDIAAGSQHSCAIQAGTGNVICWGWDDYGQATPRDAVNGVSGTATHIAAGYRYSCAIQAGTGKVVCWGWDDFGRTTPPDAVNGILGIATDIAVGATHSLAIVGPPADCLCEVQNINPNQVVLQNVSTGGKGSDRIRTMVMTFDAVDAPGAICDPGEFSAPTRINLKMEDDRGNVLVDSAKTVVCEHGVTKNLKRDVFFQGPLNCENGVVPPPKPDFSLGTITSTGSAPGTADYVESTKIKCFE
jgi:mannose/fructose/N-acetylgalactosamine-specific phosphotransferase system component IIC